MGLACSERAGIDAINVSSGTYETANYTLEPMSFECGWRKHLARAVKEVVSTPVIAANLIRSPERAEAQLAEGIQDFVCLGRPLLADAAWVAKSMEGRADEIMRCISCLHCFESLEENGMMGLPIECAVNPRLGRERETAKPRRNGGGRTVVVIGAGPAGLATAEVLASRGFKSVICNTRGQRVRRRAAKAGRRAAQEGQDRLVHPGLGERSPAQRGGRFVSRPRLL